MGPKEGRAQEPQSSPGTFLLRALPTLSGRRRFPPSAAEGATGQCLRRQCRPPLLSSAESGTPVEVRAPAKEGAPCPCTGSLGEPHADLGSSPGRAALVCVAEKRVKEQLTGSATSHAAASAIMTLKDLAVFFPNAIKCQPPWLILSPNC